MVNISIGIQVPVTGVEFYPDIKHFHTHPKEESVQMLLTSFMPICKVIASDSSSHQIVHLN